MSARISRATQAQRRLDRIEQADRVLEVDRPNSENVTGLLCFAVKRFDGRGKLVRRVFELAQKLQKANGHRLPQNVIVKVAQMPADLIGRQPLDRSLLRFRRGRKLTSYRHSGFPAGMLIDFCSAVGPNGSVGIPIKIRISRVFQCKFFQGPFTTLGERSPFASDSLAR
jgi:hypothetical protein